MKFVLFFIFTYSTTCFAGDYELIDAAIKLAFHYAQNDKSFNSHKGKNEIRGYCNCPGAQIKLYDQSDQIVANTTLTSSNAFFKFLNISGRQTYYLKIIWPRYKIKEVKIPAKPGKDIHISLESKK